MMVNNKKEMKRKGNVIRVESWSDTTFYVCVYIYVYMHIKDRGRREGKRVDQGRVGFIGWVGRWEEEEDCGRYGER